MTPAPRPGWTAVVLTGGRARRLGRPKAGVSLGGSTMLEQALAGLPPSVPVVIVGDDPGAMGRATRSISVTRESPAFGGPAAGLLAGLRLTQDPVVGVLSVDTPWAGPLVARLANDLLQAAPSVEGMIACDASGHPQYLCASYRTAALRRHADDTSGQSMRSLVRTLQVTAVPADDALVADIDTPRDLKAARDRVWAVQAAIMLPERQGTQGRRTVEHMQAWVDAVSAELGLEGGTDVDLILDVAKDVAHGVARPAAPVTAFLLGRAVAAGADPEQAATTIRSLAEQWQSD